MITIRPTKKQIFSKITSYDIFKFYCPNFITLNSLFKDNIRTGDKNPSTSIAFIGGDLLYKDFGTEGSYRAVDYVSHKFGLSFHTTLEKISDDFGLGFTSNNKRAITKPSYNTKSLKRVLIEKTPALLDIKTQSFTKTNLKYWKQYGWTEQMLKTIKVNSISHYWLTNTSKGIVNRMVDVSNIQAFSYNFYFHKGIFRRKLYFPYKFNRFINNGDNTIVQGWDTLPKKGGDILFITSSLKDIGPFWRLGYYAVAPNSEKLFILPEVYAKLKKRWNRIIIWFDNDESGIISAKNFAKKYNIEYYYNPIKAPKDPSDFVKAEGLREFNWLIKKIL